MTDIATRKTETGLYIRYDRLSGLLVYSPFTGLFFAVPENDREQTVAWLERTSQSAPSLQYKQALGPGWCIPHEDARYPMPHLLGAPDAFRESPLPKWPIVINWLLTSRCPLRCKYCDAGDLMGLDEPSISKIESTARAILRLNPLAVVLTGGEPLLSPHLERVLELLRNRAGIIVDTSAYIAKSEHLNLLKSFGVAVRISIDAERPRLNDKNRPLCSGEVRTGGQSPSTLEAAIDVLCKATDLGLCVTVQSVAYKQNLADLEVLGAKLFRLGVRAWRVLKVQPSQGKEKDYQKLVGPHKKYKHYFEQLEKAKGTRWGEQMAVQATYNSVPNSVVLVAPDGRFLTESDRGQGKIELDPDRPYNPSAKSIFPRVNPLAHTARYLNATLEQGM